MNGSCAVVIIMFVVLCQSYLRDLLKLYII